MKYLVYDPENLCYIEYIDRIVRNLVAVQSREQLLEADQVNAKTSIKDIKARQQSSTPFYAIPKARTAESSVCRPPADYQEILSILRNSDETVRSILHANEKSCNDKLYTDVIEYTRRWTHDYRGKPRLELRYILVIQARSDAGEVPSRFEHETR